MTKDQIRLLLASCLSAASAGFQEPTEQEWQELQTLFGFNFPKEFRHFVDLMSEFSFPGEILNVGKGPNNGNDRIVFTYDFERAENPAWNEDMIPFYAIGNGDYFCISRSGGPTSQVYYFYAEKDSFEVYSPSFDAWIQQLPEFLG
jgi:hypothetical protein